MAARTPRATCLRNLDDRSGVQSSAFYRMLDGRVPRALPSRLLHPQRCGRNLPVRPDPGRVPRRQAPALHRFAPEMPGLGGPGSLLRCSVSPPSPPWLADAPTIAPLAQVGFARQSHAPARGVRLPECSEALLQRARGLGPNALLPPSRLVPTTKIGRAHV